MTQSWIYLCYVLFWLLAHTQSVIIFLICEGKQNILEKNCRWRKIFLVVACVSLSLVIWLVICGLTDNGRLYTMRWKQISNCWTLNQDHTIQNIALYSIIINLQLYNSHEMASYGKYAVCLNRIILDEVFSEINRRRNNGEIKECEKPVICLEIIKSQFEKDCRRWAPNTRWIRYTLSYS